MIRRSGAACLALVTAGLLAGSRLTRAAARPAMSSP
jgi:hypothetical protein